MNIGGIVVRKGYSHGGLNIGDIAIVTDMDNSGNNKEPRWKTNKSIGIYERYRHDPDNLRLATEREIATYKQGITNINNIPEDFQTNYIPLIFN